MTYKQLTKSPYCQQLLESVRCLIERTIGISLSVDEHGDFERRMSYVAEDLKSNSLEQCLETILRQSLSGSILSIVTRHVTVGDTYFFRDRSLYTLLERRIIPRWIEDSQRPIRVWSAACSTGEEPYSLAIFFKQLLPSKVANRIEIYATDLNRDSLKKAEQGVYREWSFRGAPSDLKQTYFKSSIDDSYEIDPSIRNKVKFSFHNLVEPWSAISPLNAMDLILCRNVLMYLSPDQQHTVINKLYQSLNPEACLLVSACETSNTRFSKFKPVMEGDTLAYQRPSLMETSIVFSQENFSPLDSIPALPSFVAVKPSDKLNKAFELYEAQSYDQLVKEANECIEDCEPELSELFARAFANSGQLENAQLWIEKTLKKAPTNPSYRFLFATILQELGHDKEAVHEFEKTLYLDPTCIMALVSLGAIQQTLGNNDEGKRLHASALHLLSQYSPETIVPESDHMTAAAIIDFITQARTEQ